MSHLIHMNEPLLGNFYNKSDDEHAIYFRDPISNNDSIQKTNHFQTDGLNISTQSLFNRRNKRSNSLDIRFKRLMECDSLVMKGYVPDLVCLYNISLPLRLLFYILMTLWHLLLTEE